MERKSTYSSSAPTKPSFLESYASGKAKADLENAMGVELPPAIDFSAYKTPEQGKNLLARESIGLVTNTGIRNSEPHDYSKEVELDDANVAQDDAKKLLRDYSLSFKR